MTTEPVIYKGRYRLDAFLGKGGLATVHRAVDQQTGRVCVVKELNVSDARAMKDIELFEREIQVLAALDNPRIPKLYDHFVIEEAGSVRFFLVQELIEGRDLEQLITSGARLTTKAILDIGMQLISVLVYLHGLRPPIIHRDIKPSNVILRNDGRVFLIDFGAVRDTVKDSKVGGSTVVGTFGYMAPEQFRGHAEPATDVFALGATLLFLATGREPADFEQKMLKLDIRRDGQLEGPMASLLEAMLEPAAEVRARYMPHLIQGFKRVHRGTEPFAMAEAPGAHGVGGKASGGGGGGAIASGSVRIQAEGLPDQIRKLVTPEVAALTDQIRELEVGLMRLGKARKEASDKVSFFDMINVFSETEHEKQVKDLKRKSRKLMHRSKELRSAWRAQLMARAVLDPLFAMDQDFDRVIEALGDVNTDRGESSSRPVCKVYNEEPVYEALGQVASAFRDVTGLEVSYDVLSARIHKATVEPDVGKARRQLEGLGVLSRGIVERVVGRLRGGPYPKLFYTVHALEAQHAKMSKAHKQASKKVSLWDWINVFSDSPDQVQLKALSRQLGGVWSQLDETRRQVRTLYQAALEGEPVLQALFAVEDARLAVGLIKAEATSHTRRHYRSDGSVRKERYYKCSLRGVKAAISRVRHAEEAVWRVVEEPLDIETIEAMLLRDL